MHSHSAKIMNFKPHIVSWNLQTHIHKHTMELNFLLLTIVSQTIIGQPKYYSVTSKNYVG